MDGVLEIREHYVTALPDVLEQSAKYYVLDSVARTCRVFIIDKTGFPVEIGYVLRERSDDVLRVMAESNEFISSPSLSGRDALLIVGGGAIFENGEQFEKDVEDDTKLVMLNDYSLTIGVFYVILLQSKWSNENKYMIVPSLAISETILSDSSFKDKTAVLVIGAGAIFEEGIHFEQTGTVITIKDDYSFSIGKKYTVITI